MPGLCSSSRQACRHAEAVEHTFATSHLTRFARGFTRLESLGRLADDSLRGRRVLLEKLREALGHRPLDKAANLRVSKLRFRLTLELGIVQLHADDGRKTLARVVAGKVAVLLFQDSVRARVIVVVRVRAFLKPSRWVPPSWVLMLLANAKMPFEE